MFYHTKRTYEAVPKVQYIRKHKLKRIAIRSVSFRRYKGVTSYWKRGFM